MAMLSPKAAPEPVFARSGETWRRGSPGRDPAPPASSTRLAGTGVAAWLPLRLCSTPELETVKALVGAQSEPAAGLLRMANADPVYVLAKSLNWLNP